MTGNNLGRLGNVEKLPGEEAIAAMAASPEVREILQTYQHDEVGCNDALHRLAQIYLEHGEVDKALCVLLSSL